MAQLQPAGGRKFGEAAAVCGMNGPWRGERSSRSGGKKENSTAHAILRKRERSVPEPALARLRTPDGPHSGGFTVSRKILKSAA
ncbi:hypothetical protein [Teichococcus coralli]|uniref:hypothetical protein n=1 Tax=Teichococcus coralli TaxID=2545983 RepID=UPI00136EFF78|nr:hypothetical protein [Pseudoroseomonas coralli]